MKRSEMIEHIAEELMDVVNAIEKDRPYFQRKAADLLDMIEGFGMQPPPYSIKVDRLPTNIEKRNGYWLVSATGYYEIVKKEGWESEVTETEPDVT